jgi:FdhD protein
MNESFMPVPVVRVADGRRSELSDVTAAEVPLEVRLQGAPFAVIMRTPGADMPLVAGFLLAERIVRSADDLATIEHCTDQPGLTTLQRGNIVTVVLEADAAVRAAGQLSEKRDVMSNSACGVCGRATLESMRADLAPLPAHARVPADVIAGFPMRLRERQPLFERTGGLHAAGIFTWTGELLASAEDVGRHNAVDKVIGTMLLRDAIPLETSALCVSGRTSYEIVQKAWCAGIPLVASVSAPSSLAVSLARDANITLVGFVRDGSLNIYTGAERIA